MSKRPNATKEQKEVMANMREAGATYAEIGKAVDMHPNAVSWHCLLMAVEPPNPPALKHIPETPVTMIRNGHELRRFTVEEDERLLSLEADGLSYTEIAKKLGRRRNSVVGRLATLARREEREELA